MASLKSMKQDVFDYASNRLGAGIIDLELDPTHYETAYQRALGTFRQRSQNSTEESYTWLELQKDQNIYTLPQEVTEVRQVFRIRSIGAIAG